MSAYLGFANGVVDGSFYGLSIRQETGDGGLGERGKKRTDDVNSDSRHTPEH